MEKGRCVKRIGRKVKGGRCLGGRSGDGDGKGRW